GVAKGLQTKKLHVSAGDTVIWHPQLPHGGSPIRDKDRTRFSLVMHVTPVGVPVYHQSVFFRPSFSFPEKAPWGFREVDGRQIADIRNGINFDHKNGYSLDRIKPPGEAVAPTNLRKTGRGRMHWEQNNFIQSVKCLFPNFFKAVSVLEIGSYDVNGSVRPQFEATRYVGVDLITGPGVDVISTGHEFRSEERFDVAISTECFEHDPFYTATFLNMVRHVREGGLVIFSCAAEGRPEHGTRRAEPASSPGTVAQGYDYYRNLSEADFAFLDLPVLFSEFRFFHNSTSNDLYFVGVKRHSELLRQIDTLCKAVESLPGQIDGAFGLLRSGKTDEALERMQAVYKSAPSSARDYVLMRQGWLLNEAKRGAAAEAVVREALTLSDAAELYWELGTILHGLGRAAEAIAPAREAVKRAPDDARFVYFLGAMLQNQNVLEEAKELLKRTISLDPKFAPAHQQLSAVLTKQGRQEEAIEEARNAAELAPEVAWIQGHLERMLSPQDVPAHNRSN
uniref:tetratricopeptide repeat protein n=1 Tax=Pseudomonas sp. TaxID=306 RepID=UPI0026191979